MKLPLEERREAFIEAIMKGQHSPITLEQFKAGVSNVAQRLRRHAQALNAAVTAALESSPALASRLLLQEYDCIAAATLMEAIVRDPALAEQVRQAMEAGIAEARRKALS